MSWIIQDKAGHERAFHIVSQTFLYFIDIYIIFILKKYTVAFLVWSSPCLCAFTSFRYTLSFTVFTMWVQLTLRRPLLSFSFLPLLHNGASIAAMAAPSSITLCRYHHRRLHTSSDVLKKKPGFFERKFLNPADLNKRPSDLEIKQKDLPPNQPTLGERAGRKTWWNSKHVLRKKSWELTLQKVAMLLVILS